jgi:hypothetical protein
MSTTIAGGTQAEVQTMPVAGRSVMQLTITDGSGNDIKLDPVANTISLSVYQNQDDPLASVSPLFTVSLATTPGITIDSPSSSGSIEIEISAAQAKLLFPQWLYTGILTVTDVISTQIIQTRTFFIEPVLTSLAQAFEITTPANTVALYTNVLNTLVLQGPQGGVGYLDGITTATQPVGCIVQYNDPASGQPRQWILEVSTHATDAGHQRPLDYNGVTNTKVWRKIM